MKKEEKEKIEKIKVNLKIYPLDAVYGASYVFIDRCYIYINYIDLSSVEVYLQGKEDIKISNTKIRGEFLNELLNYSFRHNLLVHNKKIREDIIEKALFGATYENEDDDLKFDHEDDPLGIAVPWEERFGKKK